MSGGPAALPNHYCGRLAGMRLATISLSALAIAFGALFAGVSANEAQAQSCAGSFTIDFAGLPAGTIIDDEYVGQGVQISGVANNNGPDALIVFDSNSSDPDLDADLRVGIGNIAIFANNLDDDNGDGLVDRPDENNFGGRAIFEFDQDVSIGSFKFIDKDAQPADSAIAYDASGNVIKQVSIPVAGNASVQTINVDADGVRRFEIVYGDSGGFTGIEVECPQGQTSTPTATEVAPTPTQATETETPTPGASTPTATAPGETPTGTPPEGGSPTPTVAGVFSTPEAPTQAAAVAGENPAGGPASAVLGAEALPAGGGPGPNGDDFLRWAAAGTVLALISGASVLTMRRRAR